MTKGEKSQAVKGILLVQTDDVRGAQLHAALAERSELEVVDEVTTTREAVTSARRHQPGVVVLDVGREALSGGGVLQSIREVAPDTRIVLHARDPEEDTGGDTGPGMRRWMSRLVHVVLDPAQAAGLEARLELPDEPRSVPVARSFTTNILAEWQLDEYVDFAGVLASELVANAVLHVPGSCALELTHHADVLRVAVPDTGPGMPDLQRLATASEGGRGLHIVSAFSSAWGVDHLEDGGKVVWAELDRVMAGVS